MKTKLLLLFFLLFFVSCAVKLPSSFSQKTLTENKSDTLSEQRYISFKHTTNFRDIGGLPTSEGKKVKYGLVFRSDNLSQLKRGEFDKFNTLKIKTVIDLRTQGEIELKQDNLPKNVIYFACPIVSDQGDLMAQMKGKVLRGEVSEGESKALMKEFYKKCVTDTIPLLKEIIQKIAISEEPILYHCSAGKDRTGIVTALLLSVLKVDRQTIINEYLLSNYYRSSKIKSTMQKAKILKVIRTNLNTTVILNFMAVDSDYINAVFETIDQNYGGMDAFIANELGINASMREKIINRLTY